MFFSAFPSLFLHPFFINLVFSSPALPSPFTPSIFVLLCFPLFVPSALPLSLSSIPLSSPPSFPSHNAPSVHHPIKTPPSNSTFSSLASKLFCSLSSHTHFLHKILFYRSGIFSFAAHFSSSRSICCCLGEFDDDLFILFSFLFDFFVDCMVRNTWAEWLEEPGASRPARRVGCRLGGVESSDSLDICLVVSGGGDLQHRNDSTLVQQAIRRHYFSVAILTATHTRLTQGGG